MKEEGVTSLPPITYLYFADSTTQEKLAASLRQMWLTRLGVTVKIESIDFDKWLTGLNQSICQTPATPTKCLGQGIQFSYSGYTVDYPDPQDWTTLQLGAGSSNNSVNYGQNISANTADQVANQKAMAAADGMPAGDARYKAYNPIEQQLVNDVAWCSLFQGSGAEATKPWITGWVDNAQMGVPPDYWANVYVTAH